MATVLIDTCRWHFYVFGNNLKRNYFNGKILKTKNISSKILDNFCLNIKHLEPRIGKEIAQKSENVDFFNVTFRIFKIPKKFPVKNSQEPKNEDFLFQQFSSTRWRGGTSDDNVKGVLYAVNTSWERG